MLEDAQKVCDLSEALIVTTNLFNQQATVAVEFVNAAYGLNSVMILCNSIPVAQAGLAPITGTRVDFAESLTHDFIIPLS